VGWRKGLKGVRNQEWGHWDQEWGHWDQEWGHWDEEKREEGREWKVTNGKARAEIGRGKSEVWKRAALGGILVGSSCPPPLDPSLSLGESWLLAR
jgi:hypothetical protein